MSPLLCKRCEAPVDPGASGKLQGRVLADIVCRQCGRRALYEVREVALSAR